MKKRTTYTKRTAMKPHHQPIDQAELDIITVNPDSTLTKSPSLARLHHIRPNNLFTRLILISDTDESLGVFGEGTVRTLREFSQLTSLTIDHVQLSGCKEISFANSLCDALVQMRNLRVLKLDGVFNTIEEAEKVNIVLRNIIGFVLLSCESLEVLELHNCKSDCWDDSTWDALAEANATIKLKKLSFRDDASPQFFVDILNTIKKYPQLTACEVVFSKRQSNPLMTWNQFSLEINENKSFKSLEVGSFDLTQEEDRNVVSQLMSKCQSLVSFGLRCVNFSAESLEHLRSLFSTSCTFTQLILDVDEITDCDFVPFASQVVEAAGVNQICILHNGVDVTPEGVSVLCKQRIHDQIEMFKSKALGKCEASELIVSLNKIISGLHTELSSRRLSEYQLDALIQANVEMDELQQDDTFSNLKTFLAFLRRYFEEGQVHFTTVFGIAGGVLENFPQLISEFYQMLECVLPVVGPELINDRFGATFIEVMGDSYSQFEVAVSAAVHDAFRSKTQAREALAQINSHIDVLEKHICKVILGDEQPRLLIEINVLRDVLFQGLGNRPKYVELCVKNQLKAFEADNHLKGFDAWFLRGCKTYSLHNGVLKSFIKLVVSQVKKPEFLHMTARSLFLLKPDFEEKNEKMERLHFALAILSQAVLSGVEDKTGLYADIQQNTLELHNEGNAGDQFTEVDLEKITEHCRERLFAVAKHLSVGAPRSRTTLRSDVFIDDISSSSEDHAHPEDSDDLKGSESAAMYSDFFAGGQDVPSEPTPLPRQNMWARFAGFLPYESEEDSKADKRYVVN